MKAGPSILSFVMEVKKVMILTMQKQRKKRNAFMVNSLPHRHPRQLHQQFQPYPKNLS
jgi:hypothetical protein